MKLPVLTHPLRTHFIIITSPWFFTRGGDIDLNAGSLRNVGIEGRYWSSTASTAVSHAYHLIYYVSDTYPSRFNAQWLGLSLRCVAAELSSAAGG